MVGNRTEIRRPDDAAVLFGAAHAVAAAQVRTRRAHDGISDLLHDHGGRLWGRRLYVDTVGGNGHAEELATAAADVAGGGGGVGGLDDGRGDRLRPVVSVRPDRPSQSDGRRKRRFGVRSHRHVEEPPVRL